MADISKVNNVEVGNISKVDNVEKANVDTLLSGEFPIAQADPANIDMTSGDNDHPFGANYQSYGNRACTAVYGGTTYVAVLGSDNANSRYPTVRVGTWNGSAITWGDKVTIHTDGEIMGHGIVWDEDNERFIGTMFDYAIPSGNKNDISMFGASLTTSGSGSPKIANINLSMLYRPSDDNSGSNANQYVNGGHGSLIFDRAGNRAVTFFEKGGPASGSAENGDPDDIVGVVITFTDISSNNALSKSAFTVIHDDPANARSYFTYDSNVNRIINVSQGFSSGDFKVKAGTITGSGSTLTVNSTTSYSKNSLVNSHIGNSDSSISQASNWVSYQNNPIVFDTQNNVTHVMLWDDDVDDFVLTNFTTGSDNSITWAVSNGQPIRSNGLAIQYAGGITQGLTSGWTTSNGDGQPYFTTTIGFDPQFKRIVISGSDSDDKSDVKQQGAAVAYNPTTGYNFIGTLIQMLTNAQGGGGWQLTSVGDKVGYSNTFNGGAMFYHYRQNNSTGYGSTLYGMTAGAGQRSIAGGIFSLSNASLSTARSRNAIGIGTSRIASMTGGGANTSSTKLASTEEYNGSTITAGGNMATARMTPAGTGTLTAGLALGGTTASGEAKTSEEYDGSSWSSGGTANVTGGEQPGMCGTQTDAVSAGGYVGAYQSQIEDYNGTSWSDTGVDLAAGKAYLAAAGTSNDCIFFGGASQSDNAINGKSTEAFDGTSISTVNSMSNIRNVFQSAGTKEDVILTGGSRIANNDSEYWNGTSWASGPTNGLSSVDRYSTSDNVDCGGTSAAVFFGGGTTTSYGSATDDIVHFDH